MTEDIESGGGISLGELATATSGEEGREPSSLLDSLAAQREETASARETYIPIPGYDKAGVQLLARYNLLSGDETARVGRNVMREFKKHQTYERNLYGSIDVMIEACTGIFVERIEDGERQQLEFPRGVPIEGYNESLAEALKFDVDPTKPARSIVISTFCGNILSLQTHSIMLSRWMGDTSVDVAEEMMNIEGNL